MSSVFLTSKNAPGAIAKLAAKEFVDNLYFCKSIQQLDYSDFTSKNGYQAGDTILVHKPARYIPIEGDFDITGVRRDTVDEKVPLTLDIKSTIPLEADSMEFATEVAFKNYYTRAVQPAVNALAHNVELQFLRKGTINTQNRVGTPGSTVFDIDTILSAREKMNKYLCPMDGQRTFLFDSTAGRSAVVARSGLFQDASQIQKQYKMGAMGRSDGFTWIETEMVRPLTNGNDVTGVETDGATAEGATSLAIEGLTTTTGTVTAGSVFTLEGVYAVHPITKDVYPFLQQFTVLPATNGDLVYTADGSGDTVINVYPALFAGATDGRRSISALPADGADLTFIGTASQTSTMNLAYHRDSFGMVSVPLAMPKKGSVEISEMVSYKGFTIALVKDFDVNKRSWVTRLDFLGGFVPLRPEWACTIAA